MSKKIVTTALMVILNMALLTGQKVDMSLFHGMKPRNIGPAGMSGRITAIASDPRNKDIIYIGTASGGLWKTENAGTTFAPVFDNQPVASIGAIAVDPLRPDIVWAGTGEGNPRNSVTGGYGVYKSLDGGRTWTLAGLENTRHIHRILINPVNSDIVYAGAIGSPWMAHKEKGVYKTTDGGKTWKQILFKGETVGVSDMVMDPSNPDKIIVGMWNHQRWPWFFNSGGEGSGLYMTLDGGDNFLQLKTGLPEEIGRTGIAISKNRPGYFYAYIEARPSAIYRSTDGGQTWEKRGEKGIGNRPFYYAEIYVDPSNENRIYTLYSGISMSEDGGLTFPTTISRSIHPDHHAYWIDPDNSRHIIEGNDGGLTISYDMGKTWRHITSLPLGQFYHVRYDMEEPYRIYGGLQDNGSWVGPAYVWYDGGIINDFWDFLIGGDGFDAMPVQGDPRFCYAQSQGGSVRRIDILTGNATSIRPTITGSKVRLRFNWNAAIAQDPFDNNTIYFGSQFLHKSTDRGDTWNIISPDLTTNDPEKLNQSTSGGITTDATGAENHCTIITIAPSEVQKDVIWAGTDDGNIQLTTDGGKTWNNVAGNLKGAPEKAWIPQITTSTYNAAEAYVVLNNYRMGDYSSYLYFTSNYGKTWQRIIDNDDVSGYVLCFIQDIREPGLMFAGTEYGLYVSFDKGTSWNKWTEGYPTVSTYDLAIHPRESDLIIGTFGRSIWIIDNIAPLREVAKTSGKVLMEKIAALDSPDGIMVSTKNLPGYYYRGDGMFQGENRDLAANIYFYANETSEEKLKAEIVDSDEVVVRNLETEVIRGFNKLRWRYDMNPVELAGQIDRSQGGPGPSFQARSGGFSSGGFGRSMQIIPGEYTVRLYYNGGSSTSKITVRSDPRSPEPDTRAMKENLKRADPIKARIRDLNEVYQKYFECSHVISKVQDYASKSEDFTESVKEFHPKIKGIYDALERRLSGRPEGLFSKINEYRILFTSSTTLTMEQDKSIQVAVESIEQAIHQINDFLATEWPLYLKNLASKQISVGAVINE